MARPIQITRRIKSTKFAVEYVDVTEKKIKNIETRLFGDWREKTKKDVLKALEKNFDHVLDAIKKRADKGKGFTIICYFHHP